MEFILCNTKYAVEVETSLDIKHNKYILYVLDTKSLFPHDKVISNTAHDFNKHAKFTLTQTIQNTNKPTKIFQKTLNINRKTFRLKI